MTIENVREDFIELETIIQSMPMLHKGQNVRTQDGILKLRYDISSLIPNHPQAQRALELLRACDESDPNYDAGRSPLWQQICHDHEAEQDAMKARYREKGYEITTSGWPGTPSRIYAVRLNFTPEEWVDILSKEGEFLPACCATISAIRDRLMSAVREDGFVQSSDLCEIAELLRDHGTECESEESDPINRMIKTWDDIKDEADLHVLACPENPNDLEDAFSILARSSEILYYNCLFDHSGADEYFEHNVCLYGELVKVLPAIRTIANELNSRPIAPFKGFAICDGDKVCHALGGMAIHRTKEKADRIAMLWNCERQGTETVNEYMVRPVRITWEHGIEYLDLKKPD
jgi:hypothetical protein